MIYLTFGNQTDGVYASYVFDVCNYLNKTSHSNIKIIALISFRNYFEVKKRRKKLYPNSIYIPMFPKLRLWKLNIISLLFLWLFIGNKKVMALSPIACNLALMLKKIGLVKKVIYDGEGATSAEWNEYDVIGNEPKMKKDIYQIEKNAVLKSDFRRAVSKQMIFYWKETFEYSEKKHIVIPCTLNAVFRQNRPDDFASLRSELGFDDSDVILVYSGSSAGWQSLKLVEKYLTPIFEKNDNVKLLLLSDAQLTDYEMYRLYPERIVQKWVSFEQVPVFLNACDYGILIREKSVTNKVAAPTKFAEYLSCGLKVIISDEVGDYSEFTKNHECGIVVTENLSKLNFQKIHSDEKERLKKIANQYFVNDYFYEEFQKIVNI